MTRRLIVLLLVSVLVLGAVMAVEVGLICGVLFKDITMLFTVWKSAGILLFGPAVIFMFPQIPQWIGRIFPTYYLLQPIIEISQQGVYCEQLHETCGSEYTIGTNNQLCR